MAAGRICGHHQSPMVLATQTTGFRTPSVCPQLSQLALGAFVETLGGPTPHGRSSFIILRIRPPWPVI